VGVGVAVGVGVGVAVAVGVGVSVAGSRRMVSPPAQPLSISNKMMVTNRYFFMS